MSTPRTPLTIDTMGAYMQSIFPFHGEDSNDLSFGVNEIIKLNRRIDQNWLEGEINGKVGIFPAAYVQAYARRSNSCNTDAINAGPYAQSAFPFQGESADELSFGDNEIIKLIRRIDQDWLEGEINGRVGIFPATYVQIIVDFDSEMNQNIEVVKNIAECPNDEGIGIGTIDHSFAETDDDRPTLYSDLCVNKEDKNGASGYRETFANWTENGQIQNPDPHHFAEIEKARDAYKSSSENHSPWIQPILNFSFPLHVFRSSLDVNSSSITGINDSNIYTSNSTNLAKFDDWETAKTVDNESQTEIINSEVPSSEGSELIPRKTPRISVHSMVKKIGKIKSRVGHALGLGKKQMPVAAPEQLKTLTSMDQSSDRLIDIDDCQPAIPMILPLQPVPINSSLSPKRFHSAISEPTLNELRPIDWSIPSKTNRINPGISHAMLMNNPIAISPFTPTQTEIFFF